MLQFRHFRYLTIAVMVTMISGATAMPRLTRNITRIKRGDPEPSFPIDTITKYITTETTRLAENQSKRFIASLCDKFQGYTITATLFLHTNYEWIQTMGVVHYYIVDSPNKTEKHSLCSNTDQGTGPARATCTVYNFWSTSNTLYLVTHVGNGTHDAIFSIDITMENEFPAKDNLKEMKKRMVNITSNRNLNRNNVTDEYLTEVLTTDPKMETSIAYTVLINVAFCPRPQSNKYNIDSTITETDGVSSYTQYICDKLPCNGTNIIAENKQQVPTNEIRLGTEITGKPLYVLVECWAGMYDPDWFSKYKYAFMYTGQIEPIQ